MKKLILFIFVFISLLVKGQDIKPIDPINFKNLQTPSWSYYLSDSSVWIYKGSTYGWTKLMSMKDSIIHDAGLNLNVIKNYYNNHVKYAVNKDLDSINSITFTEENGQIFAPYKIFADTINKTLAFYNDESEITMQVGQEMWSRVYNSGDLKLNGRVVRISGSFNQVATVELADNRIHTSVTGVLGVVTHDIETGTYGFVTTVGEVHDYQSGSCPEGGAFYVGEDGFLTHIRPVAPRFVIQVATCIYSHATQGKILVNVNGRPQDIIENAFNGAFIEGMKFTVSSNGTTITGSLQLAGGGDLTAMFSDGFTTIDCTPAKTITITPGTATVPQTNYVYLLASTKDIAISTSGWPANEHIKISEVAVRTAALTQSDGVLRNQNWNDRIAGSNGMGHLQHVNERVRRIPADWFSGTELSVNVVSGVDPDNVYLSVTGGKIYQMHLQDFPAQTMPTNDIHIVNHFTTPYTTVTNLNTQLTNAINGTLSDRSFSFVVWGIQNETGENSHLMLNLPIGSYSSGIDAKNDVLNYSVYTIPAQFRGVGFLIARVTFSHSPSGSGTWVLDQIQDLRGYIPNSTVGGGAAGSGSGITTYLGLIDTPSTYLLSANKLQGVNAGEAGLESKAVTATLAGTLNIPTGQQYQLNGSSIIVDAINDGVTTTTSSQNAIFDGLALKEPVLTKGNLTESVSGLQLSATRQVIGGAADLSLSAGFIIPTTTQETNWTAGFDNKINSLSFAGTSTKTLTLTQQDGGTVSGAFTIAPSDVVSSSSESVAGIVQLATTVETLTGINDTKTVTPLKLVDYIKVNALTYNDANQNVNLGTYNLIGDTINATSKLQINGVNVRNDWVADAITDGVTTVAPSQNAVFDALALKLPVSNPTATGLLTTPNLKVSSFTNAGYVLKTDASGNIYAESMSGALVWKGAWDASTNTPTLANGTGTAGWLYRVSVGGTVNFGAGNITFNVGDDVIYNGSIWERNPAATVTGNPLTKTDDTNITLTLGGSPTTALVNAASITAGWNGTLADSRITSSGNWNSAYNDKINSLAVTGTTTKTITLTQQDAGTVTSNFTDEVNDADSNPSNEIQDLSGSGTTLSGYTLSLSSDATTVTLPAEADGSTSNEIQTLTYTPSTRVLDISLSETDATLPLFSTTTTDAGLVSGGSGISAKFLRGDNTWQTAVVTETDGSVTNEGLLSTVHTTNNSTIQSNTSGSNTLNLKGAGINVVSGTGNNITVTGTEVDGSISNEIQSLITTGGVGNISISSGNELTLNVNDHSNRTALNDVSGVNTGDQTLASLGAQPQLNGTGFVKASGTTISYDNSTYQPLLSFNELSVSTAGIVAYTVPFTLKTTSFVWYNGTLLKQSNWSGVGTTTLTLLVNTEIYDTIKIQN